MKKLVCSLCAAFPLCLAAAPASALTIVRTNDASVAANLSPTDAAAASAAFDYAAGLIQSTYSDPIQINIIMAVSPGTSILGQSNTNLLGYYTYSQMRSALIADATVGDADDTAATGSLGVTDPTGGGLFVVTRAQGKALGAIASDSANDGTFTFGAGFSYTYDSANRAVSGKIDFIAVALHEISEIMGRIGILGANFGSGASYGAADLFRYKAANTRSMNQVDTSVYFSLNSGTTNLKFYNNPGNGGDLLDWASGTNDAFNAFSSSGVLNDFSAVDKRQMNVIGYNLVGCGDGVVGAGESCDLGARNGATGSCCTASCTFASSATVCRASAGGCDTVEKCTGGSSTCPIDSFVSVGTVCRAQAGVCDVADTCTGSDATCPDNFRPVGTSCRGASGICDVAEACTGLSASCPADGFQTGTPCRASAGVCDSVETCTGASASCPADTFATGATCRASAGVCDAAETCTGASASCPADSFATGTTCRASAGVCDVAETCDGGSINCPADTFAGAAVTCRPTLGVCDQAESCTGASASCPTDVIAPPGTPCPSDGNACTNDVCDDAGLCGVDISASCVDADPCTADSCDPGTGCVNAASPSDSCLLAPKTSFAISDSSDDTRDKLSWKWSGGEAFDQVALGNPTFDTTYTLCVYDYSASVPSIAASVTIDPSAFWTPNATGLLYVDKPGASDGVVKMSMKAGAAAKTSIKLSGKGLNLPLPAPAGATFFQQDPEIVVQLVNSTGTCWTSQFGVLDMKKNVPEAFKAQTQ